MEKPKLKPCAHCGSEDIEFKDVLGRYRPFGIGTTVRCKNCSVQTGVVWHKEANGFDGEPEAAEIWNTRVGDTDE